MHNYQKVIDLSNELISSVRNRDALLMQQQLDALDLAYREEFGDYLDSFESMKAFVLMNLASAKYFSHNNMFSLVHCRFKDVAERIEGFLKSRGYSDIQVYFLDHVHEYDYAPERDLAELLPGNLLAKGLVKAIGESPTTL